MTLDELDNMEDEFDDEDERIFESYRYVFFHSSTLFEYTLWM